MAHSALDVANTFLDLADNEGVKLTNMQVQKLVYIAQGFHLASLGQKLYFNNTHAWQWGPVIPQLYKQLRIFKNGEVEGRLPENEPVEKDSASYGIIKIVWDSYKGFSGGKLSSITHRDDTPWRLTWDEERFGVIDEKLIEQHYKKLLASVQ